MRCFIQPDQWTNPTVTLGAEESHHALGVLKAREGQVIDVFNGCGGRGRATITSIRKHAVTLSIDQRTAHEPRTPDITLILAVPREQKMDFALQKAVELEATAIAPVLTEHCVVRLKEAQAEERLDRWQKIALNAGKQSGCAWLPRIAPVMDLDRYLAARPAFDLLLVGALTGQTRPFKEALRGLPRRPKAIGVFIGPEGDFSGRELQAILSSGAIPVTFGDNVLRVETAALYALSVLRYEFGPG